MTTGEEAAAIEARAQLVKEFRRRATRIVRRRREGNGLIFAGSTRLKERIAAARDVVSSSPAYS